MKFRDPVKLGNIQNRLFNPSYVFEGGAGSGRRPEHGIMNISTRTVTDMRRGLLTRAKDLPPRNPYRRILLQRAKTFKSWKFFPKIGISKAKLYS